MIRDTDLARRGNKRRASGTLKHAVTQLLAACGGAAKAARHCRVGRAQLYNYSDPSFPDMNIPSDVVADLERAAGDPIVTRWLSLQSGQILVNPDFATSRGSLPETKAALLVASAEFTANVLRYAATEGTDPEVDTKVVESGDALVSAFARLRTHLVEPDGERSKN